MASGVALFGAVKVLNMLPPIPGLIVVPRQAVVLLLAISSLNMTVFAVPSAPPVIVVPLPDPTRFVHLPTLAAPKIPAYCVAPADGVPPGTESIAYRPVQHPA